MGFNFTTLSYGDILSQWKFNGNGDDSSGNNNVFTASGPVYDDTVVHEGSDSLYLNGSGQYGTSDINLGHQLTVAVWVNVDDPIQPDLNTILSNVGTFERCNGFKRCINQWQSSDQSVVIEVGDGSTGGKWVTDPGLIQPGSWYHLAFVIDQPNHSIKIYYNGAEAQLSFISNAGSASTSLTIRSTLRDRSPLSRSPAGWTSTSRATSTTCASTTACSPPRKSPKSRRKSNSCFLPSRAS